MPLLQGRKALTDQMFLFDIAKVDLELRMSHCLFVVCTNGDYEEQLRLDKNLACEKSHCLPKKTNRG